VKGRALALVWLAAALLFAPGADAATVTDRPLLFSFDGSDTSAGRFGRLGAIEIDQASGSLYAIDMGRDVIDKFDLAGQAQDFAASGASSLSPGFSGDATFLSESDIAVDNSAANPGRIYAMTPFGPVKAFSPAGQALWEMQGASGIGGLAVDASGQLWLSDYDMHLVHGFAASGAPPAEIGSFATNPSLLPARLDLSASGDLYLAYYLGLGVVKYSGGVQGPTLDPGGSTQAVTVDRSSPAGHIFTLHLKSFNEYEASGAPLGAFALERFEFGRGIAYDASLDRVYVAEEEENAVDVFGPAITGTVPDATIEATSEVGLVKAQLNGRVNPQGVPNAYYFQWREGSEGTWVSSPSSTPQLLPEDSSDHAVSFAISELKGDTTYQARLVVENTEKGLRAFSSPDTFKTPKAPAPPQLTIADPTEVGTTTATVSGTIDPEGDTADWRVQTSTDPACLEGFTDTATQTLDEVSEVPVEVSYPLSSLLPSQHYCVRIRATNSAGTTTSEVKQFETAAIVPDGVEIAAAAPRLDTSAHINARVDPHGDVLAYRFEYREEGAVGWIPLGVQEDQSQAREQIVIGAGLGGLKPDTAYSYRLGLLEDSAGSAPSLGAQGSFTTRSSAEARPPTIGVELVNNPDKGDQNALARGPFNGTSPISADGSKALWTVTSGAPGSNSGTETSFLAERNTGGWHSRSLVPPVAAQVGGGEFAYRLENATPDFSHFVSLAGRFDVFFEVPETVVRLDASAAQVPLTTFAAQAVSEGGGLAADITANGAHVVMIDPASKELEDIGSSTPEPISVMPGGSASSCDLRSFTAPLGAGGAAGVNWRPGYRRISEPDAAHVYFEVAPNGDCASREGLYERNRESEETTLIDPGLPGKSPELIRSTPDGRHAYFVSASQLDPSDANSGKDVYRWDEGTEASACLTCAVSADAGVGGGLNNRVLVSNDFSHIYFPSLRQLVPGRGHEGSVNIYALSGAGLHFVSDANGAGGLVGEDQSQLSADGEVFVFRAAATPALSADEVAAQCLDPRSEPRTLGSCTELYRYDDRDGSLECLSCVHDGLTTHAFGTLFLSSSPVDFQLSADGSTTAFVTEEALLPRDVNEDTDVYEWRDGSLTLITDGVSEFQESFAAPQVGGIDASGSNVLFSVVQPGLTGFERDRLANVYDARIGGGFEPDSPPAPCAEDSCQGALAPPPAQALLGSASFQGRGNVKPGRARRRCPWGRTRHRPRCATDRHKGGPKHAGPPKKRGKGR